MHSEQHIEDTEEILLAIHGITSGTTKQQHLYCKHFSSSVTELMLLAAPDYSCHWINAAGCRAFNKKPEEIIGHSLAELFGEETFYSQVKEELDLSLTGKRNCVDACFPVQDTSRSYRISYAPATFHGIDGVVVLAQDISGLKTAPPQCDQRYSSLIDLIPLGITRCDLSGRFTLCNPASARILGYSQAELLGKNFWDTMITNRGEMEFRNYFSAMVSRHPDPRFFVAKYRRKNGMIIDVETDWTYERDHAGTITGFIAVITDVTRRVQTEKALLALQANMEKEAATRTALLEDTVKRLHGETNMHKNTVARLWRREDELQQQSKALTESNIALKVLLQKGSEQKHDLEARMQRDLASQLSPLLETLKKSTLPQKQQILVELIELRLHELVSPADAGKTARLIKLTPTEITVANLIKQGRTTKEIAEVLGTSPWTVNTHRENIRKKIGIKKIKQGLRKTLLSLHL